MVSKKRVSIFGPVVLVVATGATYSLFGLWMAVGAFIVGTIVLGWKRRNDGPLPTDQAPRWLRNDGRTEGIRIHAQGAKISDPAKASELQSKMPTAFRLTQDLLVAVKQDLELARASDCEGRGPSKGVTKLLHELQAALHLEGSVHAREVPESSGAGEIVSSQCLYTYLSDFSDAYPNWQDEYLALQQIIKQSSNEAHF